MTVTAISKRTGHPLFELMDELLELSQQARLLALATNNALNDDAARNDDDLDAINRGAQLLSIRINQAQRYAEQAWAGDAS